MKKLNLIRHGEVVKPQEMILTGSIDLPLTGFGRDQIKNTAKYLEVSSAAAIFCSPLLRARQSAEILFHNKKAKVLPKLSEIDFGEWENQSLHKILKTHPEEIKKWENDFENFAFPAGESVKDFIERISHLANFFFSLKEKEIFVVTHKGVITFLICHFLGISYQKYLSFHVDTASHSVLTLYEKDAALSALNIQYHKNDHEK